MRLKLTFLAMLLLIGCSDLLDKEKFDVDDLDNCIVTCAGKR